MNIALALVAGALAVLTIITAHDTFAARSAGAVPSPVATTTPTPSAETTSPAAPVAPKGKPEKPKGHG